MPDNFKWTIINNFKLNTLFYYVLNYYNNVAIEKSADDLNLPPNSLRQTITFA